MIDFSTLKALTIPEGEVIKIERGNEVLWELVSGGLPKEYQEVEWIGQSQNGYIDLGFSFDTKAKIYITQIVFNKNASYLFGAAENSGKFRCMLTSPSGSAGQGSAYGSNGSSYITCLYDLVVDANGGVNELEFNIEPKNLYCYNHSNGMKSAIGTTQAAYTMSNNLYLLAQNYNGSMRKGALANDCVGTFKYYDKNDELICDLVPCYRKSDGVIGMYDLARNIFLTNAGTGTFTKGADV